MQRRRRGPTGKPQDAERPQRRPARPDTCASAGLAPGPARRPGVAGSVRGRVAAWLAPAPPRGAALRGAMPPVSSALPGSAEHGPAPSPLRRACSRPVLAKPFMFKAPDAVASSHRRRKPGRSGNMRGPPPDVAGWAGRTLAGLRRGGVGGARARPSPPHSPSCPPPLPFFSFFSPPPLPSASCSGPL